MTQTSVPVCKTYDVRTHPSAIAFRNLTTTNKFLVTPKNPDDDLGSRLPAALADLKERQTPLDDWMKIFLKKLG